METELLSGTAASHYSTAALQGNLANSINHVPFSKAIHRPEREADLRHAIRTDQFVMYYQARVDAESGDLAGMEALIRWQHPAHGVIPPGEFIPLAESTGMIEQLGELAMRKVIEQLAEWCGHGVNVVPVSVNVSARQLTGSGISRMVWDYLSRYAVEPTLLEIEITESAMMENFDRAKEELEALVDLGIRLHIDDFGTGYSSLSLLSKIVFSVLKVDRHFVCQLNGKPRGKALCAAIVSIARALNMRVIAEGVETSEQMDILRELGCDEIQGFLVSRPLPAAEATLLLRRVNKARFRGAS